METGVRVGAGAPGKAESDDHVKMAYNITISRDEY